MKKPKKPANRANYKVGKGRPPEETRFKKGQSGNPKGRPKGSQSLLGLLAKALKAHVPVRRNGRESSMTVLEAAIFKLVNLILAGNLNAMKMLFDLEPKIAKHVESSLLSSRISPTMSLEEATKTYMRLVKRVA